MSPWVGPSLNASGPQVIGSTATPPVSVGPSGKDLGPHKSLIAPQLGVTVAARQPDPPPPIRITVEVGHGCVEIRRP